MSFAYMVKELKFILEISFVYENKKKVTLSISGLRIKKNPISNSCRPVAIYRNKFLYKFTLFYKLKKK